MLSDRTIKAIKKTNVLMSDGGGLYLRVSQYGTKTFLYRKKTNGKTSYQTLGEYPILPLAEARKKVSELQGHAVGHFTVSYAIEQYLKSLDYLHPDQVKQRLEKDIVPEIGKLRLTAVTSADISGALEKIVARGSPVSANRTLADVRHVFNFAYEKGWISKDPSLRITRKVVGGREKTRSTVLGDPDLSSLIKVLRTARFEPKTRVGLALCLLTGQRASEVLGITQGEIHGSWWTVPKERTKSKREHKVFLVPLARRLSRHADNSDHRTLSRALKRMEVRYTPHDLRRTMATKLSDLGVAPHVIEKMLNHQMEGVMATYNRAEYLPEREAAWRLWYSYLRRLTLSSP
jgi:integrase